MPNSTNAFSTQDTPRFDSIIGWPSWLVDGGVFFGSTWMVLGMLVLSYLAHHYGTGAIGLEGSWIATQGVFLGAERAGGEESQLDRYRYRFAYTVEGQRYEAISYGEHPDRYEYAWKVFSPIPIEYSASDPQQACIVGLQLMPYRAVLFVGLLLLLFGGIVAIGSFIKNLIDWLSLKDKYLAMAWPTGMQRIYPNQPHIKEAYQYTYSFEVNGTTYHTAETTLRPHPKKYPRMMLLDERQTDKVTMVNRLPRVQQRLVLDAEADRIYVKNTKAHWLAALCLAQVVFMFVLFINF